MASQTVPSPLWGEGKGEGESPRQPFLPAFSLRWIPVGRRHLLVWRKLSVPSLLGNFGDPLLYLLALGYGLGRFVGTMQGMPYISFLASGLVCSSAMNT